MVNVKTGLVRLGKCFIVLILICHFMHCSTEKVPLRTATVVDDGTMIEIVVDMAEEDDSEIEIVATGEVEDDLMVVTAGNAKDRN